MIAAPSLLPDADLPSAGEVTSDDCLTLASQIGGPGGRWLVESRLNGKNTAEIWAALEGAKNSGADLASVFKRGEKDE